MWGYDVASHSSVTFKYDPFGRRIYKSSSSGTSMFAYDGDNLIEEANSGGTAVARYSQGLNIDEPLAMLRSSTTSFYQADGLGSPLKIGLCKKDENCKKAAKCAKKAVTSPLPFPFPLDD